MLSHNEFSQLSPAHADEAFIETEESELVFETDDHHPIVLPRAKTNIEAVMGLLAAFFIGLPAPLLAVGAVTGLLARFLDAGLLVFAGGVTLIATGYLCVTVVRLAAKAIEGEGLTTSFYVTSASSRSQRDESEIAEQYLPLAIAMAIRLPTWWWSAMRPVIALWWLAHFIAAAIFGHIAARMVIGANNVAFFSIPCALAVNLAFLFAANLYLMLAIAVGIPRPRIWVIAWKYRLFFDLVVTIVTIACS